MLYVQYPLLNYRLIVKVPLLLKTTTLHTEKEHCHAMIDTGFTGWIILPTALKQNAKDLLLMKMPFDQCPRYRSFKEPDDEISPSIDTYRGLQLGIHDFQRQFHYFESEHISFEPNSYGVIGLKFLLHNKIDLLLDSKKEFFQLSF